MKINIEKLVPQKCIADARRERYIERKGYIIIPFYAEDILSNPEGCVNKTIEIINKFRDYKRLKD